MGRGAGDQFVASLGQPRVVQDQRPKGFDMGWLLRVKSLSTAVWLIAASFLAGTILVRTIFTVVEYREAVESAEVASRHLARLTEQYTRRTLQTADLVMENVAAAINGAGGVDAFRGQEAHAFLRDLTAKTVGSYIMVIGPHGRPTATSSDPAPPQVELSDRAYFQAHLAGEEVHVGQAIYSRVSNELLFTITRALRSPEGRLEGVVQIAIPPSFFQVAVNQDKYQDEMVGLWNYRGEVVAWTGLNEENLGFTLQREDLEKIAAGTSGTFIDQFVGERRVISYVHIAGWPLIATGSIPFDSATATVKRNLVLSLALLAPLYVGVVGLALFAVRLGRRQDALAEELALRNADLVRAKDELEAKVAERTAAMAAVSLLALHNEAKLRASFDATLHLVALMSTSGELLEVNRAAADLIGLNPRDAVGKRVWDLPPGGSPASEDQIKAILERAACGSTIRNELTLETVNGTRVVDYSVSPVRAPDGTVTALIAEGRDITAWKEAQAQLREAQKAEALGHLTGGVAHDFNNLLMAILGSLELVRKRLEPGSEHHRLLSTAIQGAERGAVLTQRLLAFARRQDLKLTNFDIGQVVAGLEPLVRPFLGHAIHLDLHAAPDLPPVRGDQNQTELALLNLCINARDAMPTGGRLRIVAEASAVAGGEGPSTIPSGNYVVVSVTDDGVGMDAQTLNRATEPFFTTKGPGKGSGLGLSMVQGMAAQSGGAFRMSSIPGNGTTAEIWLPAADISLAPVVIPEVGAEQDQRPAARLRVLVVDDDALVVMGTVAMLEDLGHQAVETSSAREALRVLEHEEVDLLLTDYAMPEMTGLELIKILEERRPGLPVVLASGFADQPVGVERVPNRLAKPYRQSQLAAAISDAMKA